MESDRRQVSHYVCYVKDEALEHFGAAERLKPDGWKENRQFLAKSLVQLGEVEEAVVWLERAASMPVKNPDVRKQQNLLNVTKGYTRILPRRHNLFSG